MNLDACGTRLVRADVGEIDHVSPKRKAQLHVIGVIDEWGRGNTVQRTREGVDAKKAKDVRIGRCWRNEVLFRGRCPPHGRYVVGIHVWFLSIPKDAPSSMNGGIKAVIRSRLE
ncbi:MAG: hypothetical protein IKR86_08910 [Candidatus Methanomethylophilaceae archaeon]|nr:hypothetical protein [Candidatus Methanomethylophilaceae archaeon]